MRLKPTILLTVCGLLTLSAFVSARAEFAGVSGLPDPGNDSVAAGGNPSHVARSLANGFPLWYMDGNGRKISPCLDFSPIIDTPSSLTDAGEQMTLAGVNHFCTAESLFMNPALPVVFNGGFFPENFPEMFSWSSIVAERTGDFNGNGVQDGLILVESGLYGSFVSEIPFDGEQIMIASTFIRLRNLPPANGYAISTPYGSYTFDIVAGGTDARIFQSIGSVDGGDFLGVLAPASSAAAIRDVANLVTAPGTDMNTFFAWRPLEIQAYSAAFQSAFSTAPLTPGVDGGLEEVFKPIRNANGDVVGRQRYAAVAQDELPDVAPGNFVAVAHQAVFDGDGGAQGVILTPPAGVSLSGPGLEGVPLIISTFSLQGKIFNDGLNVAPVAEADTGFVAASTSSLVAIADGSALDVTLNDTDDPSSSNGHGIDPQAVAAIAFDEALIGAFVGYGDLPVNAAGGLLVAAPVATEQGGWVRRTIDRATGRSRFLYTPPAGPGPDLPFSGQDRFLYVVQDRGGLLSTAAVVTIHVEAMTMSVRYRARNGRWIISGTTSEPFVPDPFGSFSLPNTISIFNGATIAPEATPLATATVQTDGTWRFHGKLPVSPDSPLTIRSANGVPMTGATTQLQ